GGVLGERGAGGRRRYERRQVVALGTRRARGGLERLLEDGRVQLAQETKCERVVSTDDDPVRIEGVVHCPALGQELRVGSDVDLGVHAAGGQVPVDDALDVFRAADGHGGLVDDDEAGSLLYEV